MRRLAGHALHSEGAGYLVVTCTRLDCCLAARTLASDPVRNWFDSHGHGVCTCGATSGHLDSAAGRRRWHREHKQQVMSGGGTAAS